MDKISNAIKISIEHDMRTFASLTPKRKYSLIVKNISDYHRANRITAYAKTVEDRDLNMVHASRIFALVSREIFSLDEEQTAQFINYALDRFDVSKIQSGKHFNYINMLSTISVILSGNGADISAIESLINQLQDDLCK